MHEDLLTVLRSIDAPLLSGIEDRVLEVIASDLDLVDISPGIEIFPEDSPGDALFFIVEGEVVLRKAHQDLLVRGRGECIGEMALIDDSLRSAGAVARQRTRLLRWRKEDFRRLLAASGEVALAVSRQLSIKIRESSEALAQFQQDTERAAQVQGAMLPALPKGDEALPVQVFCRQSAQVGGDYYDYFDLEDGKTAVVIADAQGHGFSAALLVAMFKTQLYGKLIRDPSPLAVIASLNAAIKDYLSEIQTITAFYALLDRDKRSMLFAGAGHPPQFLYSRSKGEVEALGSQNMILGFQAFERDQLDVTEVSWQQGDTLLLYTDGVTEAADERGHEFGAQRLMTCLERAGSEQPADLLAEITRQLGKHVGHREFLDDVTLLAVGLS